MGKEARDTTPPDSIAARARRDSAAAATARLNAARPATTQPDMLRDSIVQALLRLENFTPTEYKAKQARFNSDSGVLILRADSMSKATVVQASQTLTADSLITYNRNTSIACGMGRPVLTGQTAEAPVESQRVCYNTTTREGTALGATTRISEGANWIVMGDLSTRDRDLYLRHGRFTDCNITEPHYHFSAQKIKVVNKDVLVARGVTMVFGDVPVFYLPFFMQSMKQGRRSGVLMPRFSVNDIVRRNSRYNRRIENVGVYWAASEHVGAELALDWFANNWTGLGGSVDYRWVNHFLSGGLTYREFWKTEGGRERTIASSTDWAPDERTSLRGSLQYSTSSAFIRDRSYDPRELNRSIDSNGGLNRRFDWGSVSMQVSRRQFLTDNKTDYTLPSLGVSLSQVTLFPATGEARWYNNATWTGNAQTRFTRTDIDVALQPAQTDRREVTANASSSFTIGQFSWSQSFDLRDAKQDARAPSGDSIESAAEVIQRTMSWSTGLNYQQRLIGTSTFTPGVSLRGDFARDSAGRTVSAPVRFDLNASVRTDLFGFWPGFASIERIRHRLSPTFTYNYSPAVRPDSAVIRLFNSSTTQEQNRLSIGLSQTIEGKFREPKKEPGDTTTVPQDTTPADPNQPRRRQQAQKMTLLSLNTDAVIYDFVQARDGHGVQTQSISNTINSDLLRGLQLSITHDLFRILSDTTLPRGAAQPREFSPHLSRVMASFSLTGSSWLFRTLGLAGRSAPDVAPATGSTPTQVPSQAEAGPPTDPSKPELGLLGTRNRGDAAAQQPRSAVGSWNASVTYSLIRPREIPGTVFNSQDNQMVTANVNFQPTQNWNVAWNTGYSFTESKFTDHVLTLTRQLHDWDANFDFVKAQNGNFSFQFRVQLRANPDIKFDYQQRNNNTAPLSR